MKLVLVAAILATLTCQARAESWSDSADEKAVLMQGAGAFAGSSCTGVGLNLEVLNAAIRTQNVNPTDMDKGGRLYWPSVKIIDFLLKRPDRNETCVTLWMWFGPNGNRVPGILFMRRS